MPATRSELASLRHVTPCSSAWSGPRLRLSSVHGGTRQARTLYPTKAARAKRAYRLILIGSVAGILGFVGIRVVLHRNHRRRHSDPRDRDRRGVRSALSAHRLPAEVSPSRPTSSGRAWAREGEELPCFACEDSASGALRGRRPTGCEPSVRSSRSCGPSSSSTRSTAIDSTATGSCRATSRTSTASSLRRSCTRASRTCSANTVPFVILGVAIALAGARQPAPRDPDRGARERRSGRGSPRPAATVTVGASGVVFGYATYLISRGLFDRQVVEIARRRRRRCSSSAVRSSTDLIPHAGISWEAHLFGGVGGVLAAAVLSRPARRQASAPGATSLPASPR